MKYIYSNAYPGVHRYASNCKRKSYKKHRRINGKQNCRKHTEAYPIVGRTYKLSISKSFTMTLSVSANNRQWRTNAKNKRKRKSENMMRTTI